MLHKDLMAIYVFIRGVIDINVEIVSNSNSDRLQMFVRSAMNYTKRYSHGIWRNSEFILWLC